MPLFCLQATNWNPAQNQKLRPTLSRVFLLISSATKSSFDVWNCMQVANFTIIEREKKNVFFIANTMRYWKSCNNFQADAVHVIVNIDNDFLATLFYHPINVYIIWKFAYLKTHIQKMLFFWGEAVQGMNSVLRLKYYDK